MVKTGSTFRDVAIRLCLQGTITLLLLFYLMFSPNETYFHEEYYVTYFVGCFCLGTLIILQYSNWFKDIAYVIRRWKIKSNLTALQKNREHNCFSNTTPIEYLSPTEIGFAPSDEQILIENPYITDFDSNSQDDCVPAPNSGYNSFVESLSFKAGSDTGSWLVVKYERDAKAKLGLPWLLWHHKPCLDSLGDTYINITKNSTENDEGFAQDYSEQDSFKTNGLNITVLEPFRRWRIVYNGMMRNIRNGNVHHVRMNLIWSSLSSPYEWKSCHPKDQLIDCLSNNEYFDQFLNQKDTSLILESTMDFVYPSVYNQWGAVFGKVLVDLTDNNFSISNEEQDKLVEIDVYYRGLRERNAIRAQSVEHKMKLKGNKELIGEANIWTNYYKNELNMTGITENGFHFIICQVSFIPKPEHTNHKDWTYSFGHMMIPGRDVVEISEIVWPNEFSKHLYSKEGIGGYCKTDAFFVRFRADGRWFNVSVEILTNKHLRTIEKPVMTGNTIRMTNKSSNLGFADIAPNCGRGRALLEYSTSNYDHILKNNDGWNHNFTANSPTTLLNRLQSDDISEGCDSSNSLVTPISNKKCINERISGGKGSSLSVLMNAKQQGFLQFDKQQIDIKIPDGVIVTSAAFKTQIDSTKLLGHKSLVNLIKQVEARASEYSVAHGQFSLSDTVAIEMDEESYTSRKNKQREALQEACIKLTDAFYTQDVCEVIKSELRNTLNEVFLSQNEISARRFAVRSSALGEDSDELSAAGQNETFLGVVGTEENLLDAIRKCWSSLFTIQSVEYRRQNGQPVSVDMAVVIQEMVPAKAAGVMFSVHPFTGSPAEVVITANYGLGESIVSAMSEPDTIKVLHKFWNGEAHDKLSVQHTKMGSKASKVVMVSAEESLTGEGTKIESMKLDPNSMRCCLENQTAVSLAIVATRIQSIFRDSPRDIEFALDENDTIYLLQARPITSLQSWTNNELLHEFDSAIVSNSDISTKANVGEVLPGATTTLTQSWGTRILDLGIQMNRKCDFGGVFNKYSDQVIRSSHHHILLNYLDLMFEVVDSKQVTAPMKGVDLSVFGHLVTTDKVLEIAIERKGGIDGLSKIISAQWTALKNVWFIRNLMKKMKFDDKINHHLEVNMNGTSSQILHDITLSSMKAFDLWRLHSQVSTASTTMQLITFLILSENPKDIEFSNQLLFDASMLLKTNSGDVISGDCPTDLNALCKAILKQHENDDCFYELSFQEAEKWINSKTIIKNLYNNFLEKFGHRCVREFDLISKPWKEDRRSLITTLQSMVKSECLMNSDKKKKVDERINEDPNDIDTTLDQLNRKVKPLTRKILKFILPYTHGSTILREKAKSLGIKQNHEVRLAYRNLALQLAKEGLLPDTELIFHMSHFEIEKLIKYRTPIIIQKAVRRRRLRNSEWDDFRFPEMVHGIPIPHNSSISTASSSQISDEKSSLSLKGTPASSGKYKGTCRVVTKLQEAKLIEKGDILITISTDIGWSPYFPLLGGVITELGGLISHGAVVAREYGLPCIVGVEMATSKFKSGDIVVIDGSKGIVKKEDIN